MNVEKCLERTAGQTRSRWDMILVEMESADKDKIKNCE